MDRLYNIFDLGAWWKEGKGGGRDTPLTLPATQHCHSQDDNGEDDFSMVSSQARSLGGGPPTGNMISFALRRATVKPHAQALMQQEAPGNYFGGEGAGVPQQDHQNHGPPLEDQAIAGELPRDADAAINTRPQEMAIVQYSGFGFR